MAGYGWLGKMPLLIKSSGSFLLDISLGVSDYSGECPVGVRPGWAGGGGLRGAAATGSRQRQERTIL